jgi:integrase
MAQLQKLTVKEIKNAKPARKPYTMADGGGLIFVVNPNGTHWWRYRYRHNNVPKMMSLGVYPDVSLALAREKHHEARVLLAKGIDPSAKRQAERESTADSFKAVATEFLQQATVNDDTKDAMHQRFTLYVFPHVGKQPIAQIDSPTWLRVLRKVEARGTYETAQRIRAAASRVYRYAIATGRASIDPLEPLKGALKTTKAKHRATVTTPKEIGALMRALDGYIGHPVVTAALKLAPLVFVRPGELRAAEWTEFDFDLAEWRIPAHKMKMDSPHVVPLSTQAIEILRELEPLTGDGRYVFPSMRSGDRCMSDNTILGALRRLGYAKEEQTGHGFRAMASTSLNELGFNPDVIERQLAHQPRNKVRAAYNHAQYLPERRKMMQEWADYLDTLKAGATIIPMKAKH